MVPSSASSSSPFLFFNAPVNEPALYPKSSLSISSLGNALQLKAMKAWSDRLLLLCIALANNSLPVPVSPSNKTAASVGATFWLMK